ncbi:MAG: hypothetical protein HYY18_18375 [Planctomycetes bacterium]|nr:hypothetical protein [Planctomycetota bacterium]
MDRHLRLRIGCALATALLLGGPFLYYGCRSDSPGPESQAAVPDTPEGVEELLDRRGKPEEALAKCRELLGRAGPEQQPALDSLRLRCLERLMHAKKDAGDWAACSAIVEEVRASSEIEPRIADTVERLWISALLTRAAKAPSDPAEMDRVAEALFASPRWRPVSWDDPVFLRLARAWRAKFESGDVEGADAAFAGLLDDPRLGGAHRPFREREDFARQACVLAARAGDDGAAGRWFGAMIEAAKRQNRRIDLKPVAPYLMGRVETLLAAGDFAGAEAFFDRVHADAEDADRRDNGIVPTMYRMIREARWRRAAADGDWEAVKKIFADKGPHPYYVSAPADDRHQPEALLMRWKAARTAGRGEEAGAALAEVVAKFSHAVDPAALREAVRAEWTPEQLLARGDEMLKKGLNGAALACFEALPTDTPGAAERIDRCLLGIARYAAGWAKKIVSWEGFASAEKYYGQLLQRPSFAADHQAWRAAAETLLALQLDWVRLYAENEMFPQADAKLREAARRTAVLLWEDDVKAGGDAWRGVPADVKRRIEAAHADAPARIEALKRAAEKGEFLVPQATGVEAMVETVRERSAVAQAEQARMDMQLPSRRGQALDALRRVLRLYKGTKAAEDARDTIESEIRESQGKVAWMAESGGLAEKPGIEEFTWLCDLLGFHVAEVGPLPADDPFRTFLRDSLTRAADLARDLPTTRVFLLSLLADALPDDPAGVAAAEEALAKGREIVKGMAPKASAVPAREGSSLVAGHSVAGIVNQTPYHLLVFVLGPEEFYVRLNPWSRGCAVLKNGSYDNAVIVTREGVTPYRGTRAYQDVTRMEGYFIERAGGSTPDEEQERRDVTGDFRLLRAPGGTAGYLIDPDSGLVLPVPK